MHSPVCELKWIGRKTSSNSVRRHGGRPTSRRGMNVTGQGYWAEAKTRQGKSGDFITGAAVGGSLSARQEPCTAGQWALVFQAT